MNVGSSYETKINSEYKLAVGPPSPVPPPEPIMSPGEPVCSQPPAPAGGGESLFQLDIGNGNMKLVTNNINEEARNHSEIKSITKHETVSATYTLENGTGFIQMNGGNATISGIEVQLLAQAQMTISSTGVINMGAATILMN